MKQHSREISVLAAILVLAVFLSLAAPGFFSRENLTDLFIANVPVLVVALGMTLVILTGQIDISVGSTFAICAVVAGTFAKSGFPVLIAALCAFMAGGIIGSINGSLTAYAKIPSIVVTLASMVALRDALRWSTQGAWVQDLPAGFQWLGFSQSTYPVAVFFIAAGFSAFTGWALRNLTAGRAVYATGSNAEAARLMGIDTKRVTCFVFVLTGALTGFAAALNAVRFNQIPSNSGIGLEMKVIAAVVVGGASITGGRGTILGTVLGVILLSAIGPALTFLGVSPYWERAAQGAIILAAVTLDALQSSRGGKNLVPARA
jgi:rhamnose transport system permease protein